jgi:hypothetical protein
MNTMKRHIITFLFLGVTCLVNADVANSPVVEAFNEIQFKLSEQTTIAQQQYQLEKESKESLKDIQKQVIKIASPKDSSGIPLSLVSSLLGALISALVAIGIFTLGQWINRRGEKKKKRSLLKAISLMLGSIEKKCHKRIEYISTYKKDVETTPWKFASLPINTVEEIARLKNMNVDYIFDAFYEFKITEDSYVEFYSRLDFVYDLTKSMEKDYFSNVHDYITLPSNEILQLNESILEQCVIFMEKMKNDPVAGSIAQSLNNQIITFYAGIEGKQNDIKYIIDSSIDPILKLIIDDRFRNSPWFRDVLPKLKRARNLYKFVCDSNVAFASQLELRKEDIFQAIGKFKAIREDIDEKTKL